MTHRTIAEALKDGAVRLRKSGIESPRREAEVLLGAVLERSRPFLIAHPRETLDDSQWTLFQKWIDRRARGEPPQYLIGRQEFYGRDFLVDPSVLIPRPETEILVEWALQLISAMPDDPVQVLDLGTGSGCIGISLLCEEARVRLTAVDIRLEALRAARTNALRLDCASRIHWLAADALSALRPGPRFHLIVSNPPYISESEWPELQEEVRRHEPRTALLAGETGIEVIRSLLGPAKGHLRPGGGILSEFGFGQKEMLLRASRSLGWELLAVRKDLASIERCALFRPA